MAVQLTVNKSVNYKGDILRLAVMLTENDSFVLPGKIRTDLQAFVTSVKNDMP